jgi:hypothetical protein
VAEATIGIAELCRRLEGPPAKSPEEVLAHNIEMDRKYHTGGHNTVLNLDWIKARWAERGLV